MVSARKIKVRRCLLEKGVTIRLKFKPSPIPRGISAGEVCAEILLVMSKDGCTPWEIELDSCLNSSDTTLSPAVRQLLLEHNYDGAVEAFENCVAKVVFISDVLGTDPVSLEGEVQILLAATQDGNPTKSVINVFVAGAEVSSDVAWIFRSLLKCKAREAVLQDID